MDIQMLVPTHRPTLFFFSPLSFFCNCPFCQLVWHLERWSPILSLLIAPNFVLRSIVDFFCFATCCLILFWNHDNRIAATQRRDAAHTALFASRSRASNGRGVGRRVDLPVCRCKCAAALHDGCFVRVQFCVFDKSLAQPTNCNFISNCILNFFLKKNRPHLDGFLSSFCGIFIGWFWAQRCTNQLSMFCRWQRCVSFRSVFGRCRRTVHRHLLFSNLHHASAQRTAQCCFLWIVVVV